MTQDRSLRHQHDALGRSRVCWAVAALALSACSGGSTAGKRVDLATSTRVDALAFTNAFGQDVEITRAIVSVGSLRYVGGAGEASRRAPGATIREWLGVRVAHAHPGHGIEGSVVGEMLAATSLAVTPELTELPRGRGVSGSATAAIFTYGSPAVGEFARELGADVVVVEGSVTVSDARRQFHVRAAARDILDEHGEPSIVGCPFDDGQIRNDGEVTVTVVPRLWLDQVDFTRFDGPQAEPISLNEHALAFATFTRGLQKSAAYRFKYTEQPLKE